MKLLLAFKINLKPLDTNSIKEIIYVINNRQFVDHFGNYHDNGWKSLGLISSGGNPYDDRSSLENDYKKTEILKSMPFLEDFLDNIDCKKKRVRLMKLEKKSKIFTHFDRSETYDFGSLRIHIPIITNNDVITKISKHEYHWKVNEVWYADFSFPHQVENNSDNDRYHLVIDCHNNKFTDSLMPKAYLKQKKIRAIFRFFYQNLFRICRTLKINYPFA
jgi:hypothetical protein